MLKGFLTGIEFFESLDCPGLERLDGRQPCRLGLHGLNGRDWAYTLDLSECWTLGDGRLHVARAYACDPKRTGHIFLDSVGSLIIKLPTVII